ncbi:MAG: hypothetical protein ABFS12_09620 [Bacteroidota bacterium]
MKIKLIQIVSLILVISQMSFGQGGTVYSRYGIGDQIHSQSARRLGFGDLGSAVVDMDYIDGYNPAAWTNLKLTRFEISGRFIASNNTSQNSSAFYNKAMFSGLTLGFPVERDLGISFALGLVPIASLEYNIEESLEDSSLIDPHKNIFEGSGSVSKIFIGASTLLPLNFSLGAMLEYYTGTNNYASKQNFESPSTFSDIYYETRYKYSGMGTTVSLITGNFFKYFDDETSLEFRLSGMANFASDLYTDTSLVTGTSIGELTPREGEVMSVIPTKYTFGAVFGWNNDFLILFDYVFQPWSKYTFNNFYEQNFKDLTKFSIGFQYKPKITSMHASSWEQMSLRCGLSLEETQYSFQGNNVDQYSFHAGATFPFGTVNLIDVSIAVGMRGKNENNLVKEEFIKAAFSLTLGELWFRREER